MPAPHEKLLKALQVAEQSADYDPGTLRIAIQTFVDESAALQLRTDAYNTLRKAHGELETAARYADHTGLRSSVLAYVVQYEAYKSALLAYKDAGGEILHLQPSHHAILFYQDSVLVDYIFEERGHYLVP